MRLPPAGRRGLLLAALLASAVAPGAAVAAAEEVGLWVSQTIDLPLGEGARWTLWSELRSGDGGEPESAFLGPKVHRKVHQRLTLAAGATLILVDGGSRPYRLEIEARPDLLVRPRLRIDGRHRLEWLDGPGRDGALRHRHRLRLTRSFDRPGRPAAAFAAVELFLDEDGERTEVRTVPAGLRWGIGESSSLEAFAMLQRRRGEATRPALGLAFTLRP